MKNIMTLFFILCIIGFSMIFVNFECFNNVNGNVTFVADLQQFYPAGTNVIESGNKSYITADLKNLKNIQKNLNNVYSLSLEIENMSYDQFLKSCRPRRLPSRDDRCRG